jgi:hypothetical protein
MTWRVFLACAVAGWLSGCAIDEAGDVARSCDDQECPVGTQFRQKANFSGGFDVSGGYNGTTRSGSGAYAQFGEGDCEYICEAIQDCPESTFPIITETCFTCGVILADDTVDRGNCE